MLITHFTPWDHNWPYGPPPGAKPPKLKEFEWKDPNDPCQQQGSAIGCETQTLQRVDPGHGHRHDAQLLDRAHPRLAGGRDDRRSRSRAATLPPLLKGISMTIDVAGEKIEKRWCDPSFPTTGASHLQGLSADHAQHRTSRSAGTAWTPTTARSRAA